MALFPGYCPPESRTRFESPIHPLELEVTSRSLAGRGATVVIGDPSGIGHVLHHPGGVISGKCMVIIFGQGLPVPQHAIDIGLGEMQEDIV